MQCSMKNKINFHDIKSTNFLSSWIKTVGPISCIFWCYSQQGTLNKEPTHLLQRVGNVAHGAVVWSVFWKLGYL